MATSQWRAKNIAHKLSFLGEQKGQLQRAVDCFVDKVLSLGNAWIEGRETGTDYAELCQMIDSAVEVICQKCEEISDGTIDTTMSQTSHSSKESVWTPDTGIHTVAATSMAERQAVAPVTGTDGSSSLLQVLSRISVIEEAVSSIRSSTDRLTQKQASTDQQITDLTQELSKQKKHNIKLSSIEEQVEAVRKNCTEIEQNHKSRLKSLEKTVQKLSRKQDQLSTQQDELKEESFASKNALEEKLVCVSERTESVKEQVDVLNSVTDRMESQLSDGVARAEVLERVRKSLREFEDRLLVIEDVRTSLRGFEDRLLVIEGDGGESMRRLEEQLEEVEESYKVLCQMLSSKLQPLDQLRSILNKQAQTRGVNVNKLQEVIKAVDNISPRIHKLESQPLKTSFGFTALNLLTDHSIVESLITAYVKVSSNTGDCFNKSTGIFTASQAGLYVACISTSLTESDVLQVAVRHAKAGSKASQNIGVSVCECVVEAKCTTACGVGVVEMKAGDILFSCVYQNDNGKIEKIVRFTCFRLG